MRSAVGERARGLFVKLPAPHIIEMASLAELDFVIVDLEHSSLSEADALALVRFADLVGIDAIVRLPQVDAGFINRLIEEGARGIQLSNVVSVSQVEALIAATRFAPAGTRSVSTANRGAGFGRATAGDYVTASHNSPPLLIIQIESAVTVDPLHDIAAAGADVIFVGSVDLTVSAGFDSERVRELEADIADAALETGVRLGGMAVSGDRFDYTVIGSDLSVFWNALVAATSEHPGGSDV